MHGNQIPLFILKSSQISATNGTHFNVSLEIEVSRSTENWKLNPVIDAIKQRRSAKSVDPDKIPEKRLIEEILEAAMWAPNHHLTEPWRFVVIAKDERLRLGESMAEALKTNMKTDDLRTEEVLKTERQKALRAPVIIAVISSPDSTGSGKIIPQEEVVAAGAALQNILLAAHSLELGAIARTGPHSYLKPVRDYLELREIESLIGFVYLGYPVEPAGSSKRSPLVTKVQWRGI